MLQEQTFQHKLPGTDLEQIDRVSHIFTIKLENDRGTSPRFALRTLRNLLLNPQSKQFSGFSV
jgi:hypothetical protein